MTRSEPVAANCSPGMRPSDSAGSPASSVEESSGAATEWKDCRWGTPSSLVRGRAETPLNQWWEWTRS